jgi:hypothetical protein
MQLIRIIVALAGVALVSDVAHANPMFAGRSARTCDNCHVTPNDWRNPGLAERKCSMACQTCHVDPAGGGVRNTSGRFFGRSTLPMIATSPRPTNDWDRNLPYLGRRDRATTYNANLPLGPNDFAQAPAYGDSIDDPWAWGKPLGGASRYALWDGRYGKLRADPMLRVGVDVRMATLFAGNRLTFPMQIDVPVVFHPVHHLTLLVNTGARGRKSGYSDTFSSDRSFYFRDAFVLLHEAPFQSYVKAGRFMPSYGLRLDDHTSSIRRTFELDGSLPESRVTGIEVGATPNYPFINASWFRMTSRARQPDQWDIFDLDDGSGAAVNAGWRDLIWSVGASAMFRTRDLDEGGDTSTFGVYGVFNPWRYSRALPITYQAEFDFGTWQRASGIETEHAAFYQEIDWVAFNGVILLLAHDWSDPDREVIDDGAHRVQLGGQVTPYPGVTFDGRLRALMPASGEGGDADIFVQLHLWN